MKCNYFNCNEKGKLFGILFSIKFYYCERHFKIYENFINRFKLRVKLLKLKNNNVNKYYHLQRLIK